MTAREKALTIKDFKDGFKYYAWIGYEWIEVEYPKTGFSKQFLRQAIKQGLVRRKLNNQIKPIT